MQKIYCNTALFCYSARITASGANLQPLKYRIVTDSSEVDALNSLTRWAKMLTNITLPHEGSLMHKTHLIT